MMTLENPPGFVVSTELTKAAWENGFRLERGIEGGWLRFASTTAPGAIALAAVSMHGPWLLALDNRAVIAELAPPDPGAAHWSFPTLGGLYAMLDRVYRLSISLPDTPLASFEAATAQLPRTTEAERLTVQRIGQDIFRDSLLAYWNRRCPLTGITEPALLRASHIVPWASCETDAQRLDVHNGLLLSALWDAAFDAGLVTFADDGAVQPAPSLSAAAIKALGLHPGLRLSGLTPQHRANLAWHRKQCQCVLHGSCNGPR
jgi:hypothetical protein